MRPTISISLDIIIMYIIVMYIILYIDIILYDIMCSYIMLLDIYIMVRFMPAVGWWLRQRLLDVG